MRLYHHVFASAALLLSSVFATFALAANSPANISIPQLSQEPTLSDFTGMTPATALARQMTKIDGFVQREPIDGAPATQQTEVYLGYDQSNFLRCLSSLRLRPHADS